MHRILQNEKYFIVLSMSCAKEVNGSRQKKLILFKIK